MNVTDFTDERCILCGGCGLDFAHALRDDEHCCAAKCRHCGHVQVAPLPTIEEDERFYQDNKMNRNLIPLAQMDEQALMMKYRPWADKQAKTVRRFVAAGASILEIGSGYGWFAEKMRENGYQVDGIEISDDKRALASERVPGLKLMNVNLLCDELPPEARGKYQAVCMFHLLEHLSDPVLFLSRAAEALRPGGLLLVEVPNLDCAMRGLSEPYDDFSYLRAHLSYFRPETLHRVFETAGLSEIQIIGRQLYSLENAVQWLRNGKPFLEYSQIEMPAGLEWIGDQYDRALEESLQSDSLVAVGTKKAE